MEELSHPSYLISGPSYDVRKYIIRSVSNTESKYYFRSHTEPFIGTMFTFSLFRPRSSGLTSLSLCPINNRNTGICSVC